MCQKKKKRDNLEEMDKFAEMYNLLRPNMEEIENMNTPITSREIKSIKKKRSLPTNKSSGPNGFTDKFYQKSLEKS